MTPNKWTEGGDAVGKACQRESSHSKEAYAEEEATLEDFLDYWITCDNDEEFHRKRIIVMPNKRGKNG